jgi:aromatic ring-opening dioxygenase LigB subunit
MLYVPRLFRSLSRNAVSLCGCRIRLHRDFAFDPTLFPDGSIERQVSDDVAANARRAGTWLIEDARPDIVLLTTPHGIKLDYDYGIYLKDKECGYTTIGNDLGNITIKGGTIPYNVSLCDVTLASMTTVGRHLLSHLKDDTNFPVSGIDSYNDNTPMSLNWGEIIPLLLLPPPETEKRSTKRKSRSSFLRQSSGRTPSLPKPLIWTFPYRRYDHSPEMVPELLQIGAVIMRWAEDRPERIGMIVSGDLSHTHQGSGPYGYSYASALYDTAIGKWANSTDPCDHDRNNNNNNAEAALLQQAKAFQPDAKSCGFTGYVLWHGMMCHYPDTHLRRIRPTDERQGRRQNFHGRVLVNKNVTYYGMIAATFEPNGWQNSIDPIVSNFSS